MRGGAVENSRERTGNLVRSLSEGFAAVLASTWLSRPSTTGRTRLSGAGSETLHGLNRIRPFFIAAALFALFFAGRRIFRPAQACEPGEVCAVPRDRQITRILFRDSLSARVDCAGVSYVLKLFY